MANPNEEMVFDYEGGNGFDFYFAYCSVKLKFLSKKPSLLMATLENAFST